MPLYDVRCLVCAAVHVDVFAKVDEPIACPCGGATEHVWLGRASSVRGDEIDETHYDLDPAGGVIRFRSRVEKQHYLDVHGLQPFVRWAGVHDRHVPRWASMDAYTLAAAEALTHRVSGTRREAPIVCETATFTVRDL